jgi:hypothetical protein
MSAGKYARVAFEQFDRDSRSREAEAVASLDGRDGKLFMETIRCIAVFPDHLSDAQMTWSYFAVITIMREPGSSR